MQLVAVHALESKNVGMSLEQATACCISTQANKQVADILQGLLQCLIIS